MFLLLHFLCPLSRKKTNKRWDVKLCGCCVSHGDRLSKRCACTPPRNQITRLYSSCRRPSAVFRRLLCCAYVRVVPLSATVFELWLARPRAVGSLRGSCAYQMRAGRGPVSPTMPLLAHVYQDVYTACCEIYPSAHARRRLNTAVARARRTTATSFTFPPTIGTP